MGIHDSAVAVSHSYLHVVVDYWQRVEIFGLASHPGHLLFADCHGAISISLEVLADICQSPHFSPLRLKDAIKSAL